MAGARNAQEIDATGRVVMPAFVDLETSLVHSHPPPRSIEKLHESYGKRDPEIYRDILDDGARGMTALSAQSLRRRALATAEGMLQHGTATVESRAGYLLDEPGVMKALRVQSDLSDTPLEVASTLLVAPPLGADPAHWATEVCETLLPTVRRRRLASFVDLRYDPHTLPMPIASRILECARQLGFPSKVHADLFSMSSATSLAIRSSSLTLGSLHLLTDDEIEIIAASPILGVLKPGFALQLGFEYAAKGRKLVDAGVAIAVASSYHSELSPSYNMQLMILLACRTYRLRPEEAITAATINAAHAIQAGASIGSIEFGKQADLVILDVPDYREIAYYGGVNMVAMTLKRGCVVYRKTNGARLS
jgi:imidazolonepropionase